MYALVMYHRGIGHVHSMHETRDEALAKFDDFVPNFYEQWGANWTSFRVIEQPATTHPGDRVSQ